MAVSNLTKYQIHNTVHLRMKYGDLHQTTFAQIVSTQNATI